MAPVTNIRYGYLWQISSMCAIHIMLDAGNIHTSIINMFIYVHDTVLRGSLSPPNEWSWQILRRAWIWIKIKMDGRVMKPSERHLIYISVTILLTRGAQLMDTASSSTLLWNADGGDHDYTAQWLWLPHIWRSTNLHLVPPFPGFTDLNVLGN